MDSGEYIWRTVRDSKVRSAHADRDGKLFSWTNPPPGGHPAEDYNCRCWAETEVKAPSAECIQLSVDLANSEAATRSLSGKYFEAAENANNLARRRDAAWEKVKEAVWETGLSISVSTPEDFAKKLPFLREALGAAEVISAYNEYKHLNKDHVVAISVLANYRVDLQGQEQVSKAIRAEMEKKGCVS